MANSTVSLAVNGPRKTRMHRLIEEEGIVLMPGIYDALSAAVLQSLGFRAGFISGYAVSASRLGMPDIGLLTPPEMADAARAICAAAPNVAFIVDADTGGGNALNVQRTVRDFMTTGAAGLFLEDQVWPKKCGHMQGKQVIPAHEHAAKIAAAREAIGDSDFFLIARTDARATAGGLSDAIARANLYMEAGADACFVEAPRSDDEMREVCKRTNGFRAANMLEGGYTPAHATGAQGTGIPPHSALHHRRLRVGSRVDRRPQSDEGRRHQQRPTPQAYHLRGVQQSDRTEETKRDRARYDKFRVPRTERMKDHSSNGIVHGIRFGKISSLLLLRRLLCFKLPPFGVVLSYSRESFLPVVFCWGVVMVACFGLVVGPSL
ncbi:carboxyvinyl-carboxyphosphonate phosphorylmutase [Musa troglodytarum]|uniref:Carboxyvinyl-carboxyphosphonate phosphorylmutase n=1 Tax=Musa troglodytarum TaxID=320322 RepID=A0A9E7JVX5_9LILI|nr:carboxyvinyl-carboxyphosphonate phosphorylmutase [Musa troglodytarum]